MEWWNNGRMEELKRTVTGYEMRVTSDAARFTAEIK
jgi:hypothetical protein